MEPLSITIVAITAAANLGVAVADLTRAEFVLANSREVRVPLGWLPVLGLLKLAGAIGLVLGLLGVPYLGAAAGIGLTLFFVGAIVAHVRARVFGNIAFPGVFLLLAAASTAAMW